MIILNMNSPGNYCIALYAGTPIKISKSLVMRVLRLSLRQVLFIKLKQKKKTIKNHEVDENKKM